MTNTRAQWPGNWWQRAHRWHYIPPKQLLAGQRCIGCGWGVLYVLSNRNRGGCVAERLYPAATEADRRIAPSGPRLR